MRILAIILIAGFFIFSFIPSCNKQQDPPVTINENEIELSIQDINEFAYVAIRYNGFAVTALLSGNLKTKSGNNTLFPPGRFL